MVGRILTTGPLPVQDLKAPVLKEDNRLSLTLASGAASWPGPAWVVRNYDPRTQAESAASAPPEPDSRPPESRELELTVNERPS